MGNAGAFFTTIAVARWQLQRAKSAVTPQARKYALDLAIGEDKLALTVCRTSDPFSSEILTHMGLAYMEAGDNGRASKVIDAAMAAHPEYAQAYIAKSQLFRKQGNRTEALNVLLKGSDATGGRSPELENAIGLVYFEQKNYEKALEHAKSAYSNGFPLPGLRDSLPRLGINSNSPQSNRLPWRYHPLCHKCLVDSDESGPDGYYI